jgi:hypothetical protein
MFMSVDGHQADFFDGDLETQDRTPFDLTFCVVRISSRICWRGIAQIVKREQKKHGRIAMICMRRLEDINTPISSRFFQIQDFRIRNYLAGTRAGQLAFVFNEENIRAIGDTMNNIVDFMLENNNPD